ncbi:hypothetical protein PV11_09259 [Exophiala sideris]|uniref:ABC transporter domain-containing protein n=1 Tax=Exophiala sideris TaxID=1016849 RepID=A0A0D1Y9N0_9EURO|nr:hypothetical protein PV11_09259 [Exophiala sideris]
MPSHEGADEMEDIVGRQLSFDTRHERLDRQLTSEDREELRRIASSTITKQNTREKDQGDADSGVSTKDPASDDFDLYKWLMAFSDDLRREGINLTKTGISIRSLNVSGNGSELEVQETFWSALTSPFRFREKFRRTKPKHILRNFDALLKEGELLVVLGRPGSGCSTFLKTICGEVHGLSISAESRIHYNGITQSQMKKEFKGEILYNQEVDKHFPHLTVGQTLEFAASARTPSQRVGGMSRSEWAKHITKVIMAVFGLRHTYNTKVGNDFIRGVSGGERKRVSIAEMAIAAAPLAAWDNSTRGLDSATALEFIKALRLTVDLGWSTHAVAIYQASQAIYDLFDKAIVLYEGREIYYGSASKAKQFFEDQGWQCPPRQTTGDFLTSVTNPTERQPRLGMERVVPRTPDEFERYWRSSREYEALQKELNEYDLVYPPGGGTLSDFREKKTSVQAKHTSAKSPYRLSILMQIQLNTKRAYQRIWNDTHQQSPTLSHKLFWL